MLNSVGAKGEVEVIYSFMVERGWVGFLQKAIVCLLSVTISNRFARQSHYHNIPPFLLTARGREGEGERESERERERERERMCPEKRLKNTALNCLSKMID